MKKLLGLLGGAGVSAYTVFSPSDISGLALWLKADAIVGLVDTDPVSTWPDSSGNGRDATQTSTKRPLYKTAIQNALPAVRFDATDDCMVVPAFALTAAPGLTLFVVFTAASGTARMLVESSADAAANEGAFNFYRLASNALEGYHNGNGGAATGWTTTATTAHTVPVVGSMIYDYAQVAGSEVVGWVNDGLRAGTKNAAAINNTDAGHGTHAINIGARNNGTSVPSGADIFEIVLYASALSDYNRGRVEHYLNEKWDVYS